MCCRSWKTILPFAVTLLIGIFAVTVFQKALFVNKSPINPQSGNLFRSTEDAGRTNYCLNVRSLDKADSIRDTATESLKILSKPKAVYTDQARRNQVQGTVKLRVVFLANGTIGSVFALNGLTDGLTEQAMTAAREIKFEPQKVSGQPISVVKTLEYSFTLY